MNSTTNNTTNTNAGNEDYLDKGLDAAEKKFGGAAGADSQKNRGVNEKIVSLQFPPGAPLTAMVHMSCLSPHGSCATLVSLHSLYYIRMVY